jgi:hypothetical protein
MRGSQNRKIKTKKRHTVVVTGRRSVAIHELADIDPYITLACLSADCLDRVSASKARFKSFVVHKDDRVLTVCRYMERDALRAGLVERAEDWRWSRLWRMAYGDAQQQTLIHVADHATAGVGEVGEWR